MCCSTWESNPEPLDQEYILSIRQQRRSCYDDYDRLRSYLSNSTSLTHRFFYSLDITFFVWNEVHKNRPRRIINVSTINDIIHVSIILYSSYPRSLYRLLRWLQKATESIAMLRHVSPATLRRLFNGNIE